MSITMHQVRWKEKKQRIIYRDNKYVNGEILFGSNLSTTENYEENHASDERNSLM